MVYYWRLWFTWLSHDMANIAVFLPRQVPLDMMFLISIIFVGGLGYMFYEKGGRIQEIVLTKTNTKYVRSATLVDLIYSFILWYFKVQRHTNEYDMGFRRVTCRKRACICNDNW